MSEMFSSFASSNLSVRSLLRPLEAALNEIMQNLFQRLSVALIHTEHEAREHDEDHDDRRCAAGQHRFEDKEKRQSDQDAAAETDELALGQVEDYLGFHLRQVFGDGDECH